MQAPRLPNKPPSFMAGVALITGPFYASQNFVAHKLRVGPNVNVRI